MIDRIRDTTIAQRLWAIVAVSLAGLAVTWALDAWTLQRQMLSDRQAVARAAVESAVAIAADYHARAARGDMTPEAARAAALSALGAIRYDGSEYVWVNDRNRVMVMHPIKPELAGKDMSDFADPDGKKMFREFVRVATGPAGGGFVPYQWPKPGADEPVDKVSYVASSRPGAGWSAPGSTWTRPMPRSDAPRRSPRSRPSGSCCWSAPSRFSSRAASPGPSTP